VQPKDKVVPFCKKLRKPADRLGKVVFANEVSKGGVGGGGCPGAPKSRYRVLLSGSLLLPGLGSRLHLVLISFLISFFQAYISWSFPLPCPSLVALWYFWLVLLPSSCFLLWAGAAGGCLLQLVSLFAWSLFLVSACPALLVLGAVDEAHQAHHVTCR